MLPENFEYLKECKITFPMRQLGDANGLAFGTRMMVKLFGKVARRCDTIACIDAPKRKRRSMTDIEIEAEIARHV
jgi:hypothetical protein